MAFFGGRFRELLKKYGPVALGVHLSVSTASIAGFYMAIKNNVDVESVLEKVGMGGVAKEEDPRPPSETMDDSFIAQGSAGGPGDAAAKKRSRTAELATSSGGALALAIICNKALLPIRVPITFALTPPIARFLARRRIIANKG